MPRANNSSSSSAGRNRNEDRFGTDVKIVLAAADFALPLTSAVLWLRERDVDIRCVRMRPYRLAGGSDRILIDMQEVIPLPEARDHQERVAEKAQRQRDDRSTSRDMRRFDVRIHGHEFSALPKNRAAFEVVRVAISDFAAAPTAILNQTTEGRRRPPNRAILLRLPGRPDGDSVMEQLSALARTNPRRYYTNDSDLFHVGGDTWVFTNQWSGSEVEVFIAELNNEIPDLQVEYEITER